MNLDEAVFGGNTTLWNVLDAENVANLNVEFTRLEEQVTTLGRTVDNNYTALSDRINILSTAVDNLDQEVTTLGVDLVVLQQEVDAIDISGIQAQIDTLDTKVSNLGQDVLGVSAAIVTVNLRVNGLDTRVTSLDQTVGSLQSTVTSLNTTVTLLNNRVTSLEANLHRATVLRSGNAYRWNFRVGTINYFRQITFTASGNIPISANVFRAATVLDSQTGTSYNTNVKLCAQFDTFRTTGTLQYDMMLGTCYMQRTGDSGEGPLGYMSPL